MRKEFIRDWVGIAGILGTLFGMLLGAFVTWKIQARQLAHEDRVRFHERKLAIYADFITAANNVVAHYAAGNGHHTGEVEKAIKNYGMLRLVATPTVKSAADEVFNKQFEIQKTGLPTHLDVVTEFNTLVFKFLNNARDEIGVEKY